MALQQAAGPVFVVGMNGSGTTMLSDCLGHHPDLYMFPHETYVLPYFISHKKTFGDLSDPQAKKRLAGTIAKSKAYWSVNNHKAIPLDEDLLKLPGFEGVLNGIYGHFSRLQGKTRWGDKTPMYIQHMELLAEHIPGARFIHIYRDGREAAQSFHRRWRQDPRRTIYRWRKVVELGREQGGKLGPSRYMEVSYEDLTAEPEACMKKVCEYVGLSFHPDVLKSSMRYIERNVSAGEPTGIMKNSEKWRSYFTETQIRQLESLAGKFLSDLGYTVETKGEQDPTPWQLRLWFLNDKLQVTLYNFRRHGPGYARIYIRRTRDSIRQALTNKY